MTPVENPPDFTAGQRRPQNSVAGCLTTPLGQESRNNMALCFNHSVSSSRAPSKQSSAVDSAPPMLSLNIPSDTAPMQAARRDSRWEPGEVDTNPYNTNYHGKVLFVIRAGPVLLDVKKVAIRSELCSNL